MKEKEGERLLKRERKGERMKMLRTKQTKNEELTKSSVG